METKNGCHHLIASFEALDDPRSAQHVRYPLMEIIFLTVTAVISGAREWEEIVDFGQVKLEWLRQYLDFSNGIPSHDTVNRTIGLIDYRAFEKCFLNWATMTIRLPQGVLINLDGKKLRSSATKLEQQTAHAKGGKSAAHIVEAWCGELQLCLAQCKVANKSNEIIAIPIILDWLEVEGCIISIDAIGCQYGIAEKIFDKKADYILALKENQENLYKEVTKAFEERTAQMPDAYCDEQSNKGHGRIEKRICRVITAPDLEKRELTDKWKGLQHVVEISSERVVMATGEITAEKRYYISSLNCDAKCFNKLIRGHWAIENQLHWTMDVVFGEDASRKRTRNAAENFALIGRIGLNMLKGYADKVSIGRKMNKCAISDSYREKILETALNKKMASEPPHT